MKLNEFESQYSNFIDFIEYLSETLLITHQNMEKYDTLILKQQYIKTQWTTELCESLLIKLNKYGNFLDNFNLYCQYNDHDIYCNEIVDYKELLTELINMISSFKINDIKYEVIQKFIDKRKKLNQIRQFLIDNIKDIMPDAPTQKPQILHIDEIIYNQNNETQLYKFSLEEAMNKIQDKK